MRCSALICAMGLAVTSISASAQIPLDSRVQVHLGAAWVEGDSLPRLGVNLITERRVGAAGWDIEFTSEVVDDTLVIRLLGVTRINGVLGLIETPASAWVPFPRLFNGDSIEFIVRIQHDALSDDYLVDTGREYARIRQRFAKPVLTVPPSAQFFGRVRANALLLRCAEGPYDESICDEFVRIGRARFGGQVQGVGELQHPGPSRLSIVPGAPAPRGLIALNYEAAPPIEEWLAFAREYTAMFSHEQYSVLVRLHSGRDSAICSFGDCKGSGVFHSASGG